MKRVRKNDEVVVIAGKSKGQIGKVLSVQGDMVVVQNANVVKKTVRPDPNVGEVGGIKEQEAPLHVTNVMLRHPKSGKGERIGFRIRDDGQKERYFKSDKSTV